MFVFRHGSRRAAAQLSSSRTRTRGYAARIDLPFAPPPFPVVEGCPVPTCPCRETPEGMDIEQEQNISSSMASYAEQVLISTGKSDWKSKIEDEEDGVLVRQLKDFLGKNGKYSDPYHNVLLTNSSIPPTQPHPPSQSESSRTATSANRSVPVAKSGNPNSASISDLSPPASAFLLPSFKYIPTIPTDAGSVEQLVKAFIRPSQLHQSHDRLTREQKNILKRQPEMQSRFVGARKIDEIMVLICGHGGRDSRCGQLGPILKDEFEEKLQRQNVALLHDAPVDEAVEIDTEVEGYVPTARVAQISHIGGHKWAGNVIIYIPPSFKANPLSGKGIWYGRVQPEHVEGIVAKTILEGKVIKEKFRGGIDQSGEILRL